MSVINNINEVLHRIRVKLYPNYLPSSGGVYIARTNNEAVLTIEKVCAALKNRGGFTGSYETLTEYVRQFFDEAAYQLCDGYAINTGYFSIHPNVGGTFSSVNEDRDKKKHPISFRFRTLSALRKLADLIEVDVEGLADTSGWIDEFTDIEENSVNGIFLEGNQFSITGNKIKIAGDDPSCGVYFVPVDDPTKAVKATRIAVNTPTKIVGIGVKTNYMHNKLEVRTQYTNSSGILLKTPRVVTSSFVLEEG